MEPAAEETAPSPSSVPDAIAILGMGCRWPGGVRNPEQLWELLKENRDGWTRFKSDHINLDGYYHPNGDRPGSLFTTGAHLLQEDPRMFDHMFFGITAAEAMSMDPSQRKLLEVTYEAFENAGVPWHKFSGSRTGVFIGNFNNEHQAMQFRDLDHPPPYVVTGGGPTILSNRINHVFNLRGPSMVIDTACSASMYALHIAALSLRNGDCDAAIVGSGNLILNPEAQLFTTKLGAISPTSRSHTFDAAADGYSRAEGFGALYIKRLSDALASGDPIRAVIRGTSYNANGRTGGISHPSPEGQEAVMRQAYKAAGLDISGTGYFECHGTGTAVGDPIEVEAIGRVFASVHQDEPLLIGSIKPNLGHSEPASALAQIMKVVLAMEHGEIPPTIHIEKFNPAINFEKSRVEVVRAMTPWPSSKLRRVSINSFGYGGANAHCILDHPSVVLPSYQLRGLPLSNTLNLQKLQLSNGVHAETENIHGFQWYDRPEFIQVEKSAARALVLIPISAHNEQALESTIKMVSDSSQRYKLPDLLYTLGARRSMLNWRAFAVTRPELLCDGLEKDSMNISKAPSASSSKICFVFTGQGAQWPAMGASLIREYAVFRACIRYLDFVLGQLHEKPSWKIEDLLQESASTSRIHEPAIAQTVCTALQIALVTLLGLWGIHPRVSVGHSSGEIGAAYSAGRLRASEAIVIAYFRGQVVSTNRQDGLMIAVGLGSDQVNQYLVGNENQATIACYNSPESTTLSGDSKTIRSLVDTFTAQGIFNRVLKTESNAYHSYHMLSLGKRYEQQVSQGLRDIDSIMSEPRRPVTTWISSVSPEDEADATLPGYWRQNLESPVLFSDAISKLAKEVTTDLMIEIGPHTALSGPLKQIRKRETTLPPYLGTLRRGEDCVKSMLNLAGQLFLHNAPIDLVAVNASEKVYEGKIQLCHGYPCVDLPQYSFSYPEKPLYLENRFNREIRLRRFLRHDLLGSRQAGGSLTHPSWRNILRVKDLPWLDDHKLNQQPVLPAAAYIAMAVEAARQVHAENTPPGLEDRSRIESYKLRNVAIRSAMKLQDSEHGVETILNMEKVASTTSNATPVWYKFTIGSMSAPDSGTWTENCSGTICVETRSTTIAEAKRLQIDPDSRLLNVERWYDKFQEVGLGFGPSFRCLSRLQAYRGSRSAAAEVALDSTAGSVKGGESDYALHPTALDACLQLSLISMHSGQVENAKWSYVPVLMDEVSLYISDPSETRARAVAAGEMKGQRSAYAQVQLYTDSGRPLLNLGELKCVIFDGSTGSVDSSQLIREPYWKLVSNVDIDTLDQTNAQALLSSNIEGETNSFEQLGGKHVFDELCPDDTSEAGAHHQLRNLVDLQAHKYPRMRILEIGGGTGGATAAVMDVLQPKTSFKRFEEYTFTDSAGSCVADAQTKFAGYRGMTFQVFDIEQDPEAQGFKSQSFDLIIAAGGLGHFANVAPVLDNIHALLRPGGAIIFTELKGNRMSLRSLSLKLFDHKGDGIRAPHEWDQCLKDSGFLGARVALDDYDGGEVMSTTMLARIPDQPNNSSQKADQVQQDIHLVYRDYPPPLAGCITKAVEREGSRCVYTDILSYDKIPLGSCVIMLIDLENSTLLNYGSEHFQAIKGLVAKASTLAWVATCVVNNNNSEPAVMKGLLRSVATENVLLNLVHFELRGSHFHNLAKTAELITSKVFRMQSCEPGTTIDREYILRDGALYIERLVPDIALNQTFRLRHGLEEDVQESLIDNEQALKPSYKSPGLLSSLYFEPDPQALEPLKENWVQIKMEAIGLNMKDIAIATAKFDSTNQSHEGAGIVSQVGPGVTSFKEGDRVFGLIIGNMGTYQRSPTQFITKIPDGESSVYAASLPVSYVAVIYALNHLARLEKGESVLIESAAGSLGIAAIQIAKHVGAVIYATVGRDDKKDFLVDKFSIPPSRIFRSRQPNLAEEIMRETKGRGVDVILSTTQEMMHETWRCIAPLGRFIDLGRTAVLGADKLSLEVFKRNATFASFDITHIATEKPWIIERILAELKDLWENGVVYPVAEITSFEISQLSSAMTFFAKGQHTGKVVIDFTKATMPAPILRDVVRTTFDPEAAYLFVGGLGGLGRALSVWMVERGARNIIYLSRSSTKTSETESLLARLTSMGAAPEVFCCDITKYDSLASTISLLSDKWSIKGLIHAAMVEGDTLFNQASYSQIQAVLAPKVVGTKNLYRATEHLPLDFFLMTSSLVGVIGTATQAAYCAANVFQNDFALHHRSQGRPVISLDLGLILEVGSVSQVKNVQQSLERVATYGQSETEFLQLVEGALCMVQRSQSRKPRAAQGGHVITGLEPTRFLSRKDDQILADLVWHKDARFQSVVQAISDHLHSRSSTAVVARDHGHTLTTRLSTASSIREKTAIIQEAVTAYISKLLGITAEEIDVEKAMSNYGLDSLVATELRNWFIKTFSVEVTTLELLSETAKVSNLVTKAIQKFEGNDVVLQHVMLEARVKAACF